jgi:hypothetical protein
VISLGLGEAKRQATGWQAAAPATLQIIQPVDLMPNGDQSMCDGCPDIPYWKDGQGREQLVWSCRLEEPIANRCGSESVIVGAGWLPSWPHERAVEAFTEWAGIRVRDRERHRRRRVGVEGPRS